MPSGYDALRVEIPLDDVDEAILRELQVDGRRAYREIARTVGVSEGTVRTRVKRLREAGLLRILAFVDPSGSAAPCSRSSSRRSTRRRTR